MQRMEWNASSARLESSWPSARRVGGWQKGAEEHDPGSWDLSGGQLLKL